MPVPGKTLLKITISILLGSIIFVACKKEDPAPVDPTVINTTPPVFNWKINNTTNYSSDSTFCYPSITTIYAFKNGLANSLEIRLSAFTTGTYNLAPVLGNELYLVSGTTSVTASSGTLSITADANNKLSGSLSAAFSTGTITSVSGQFTDIPKRQ